MSMTPSFLRRFCVAALIFVIAAALPSAQASDQLPPRLDPGALKGDSPRAIVLFEHDVSAATIQRLARAGIRRARVFPAIDGAVVRGSDDAYIEIARWPDVTWVEDDSRLEYHNYIAKLDTNVMKVRAGKRPLRTGYSGKGVTVAVVDSGVDSTHPDLIDRITTHLDMAPTALLDPIDDGAYSERYAERSVSTDELGHGTHITGIVGGAGKSAMGADLSGVAPKAALINCKMGSLVFESAALACYQWLIDHRRDDRFPGGIRVVSNSWETRDESGERALGLMIEEAVRARISVVFSAGNSGAPEQDETSTVAAYPNRMEEVITVGAVCKSHTQRLLQWRRVECEPGEVASFSSRGPEIDVVAPGVDIWSTRAGVSAFHALSLVRGNHHMPGHPDPVAMAHNHALYSTQYGTSYAAPHVAGIVALMLDANPNLTPRQIEQILTSTAMDRGRRGFDIGYGFGLVDAYSAVRTAENLTPERSSR